MAAELTRKHRRQSDLRNSRIPVDDPLPIGAKGTDGRSELAQYQLSVIE